MRALLLILLGVIVFAATLIAGAPARLAISPERLAAAGLTADAVRGTVWNGEAAGLAWSGQPIGDVRFSISPMSLLSGRASGRLELVGPAVRAQGKLEVGLNAGVMTARDVTVRVDVARLPALHDRVRARGGEAQLVARVLSVRDGACAEADGRVDTDVLTRAGSPRDWLGPALTGPVTCRDGAFVAALAGADETVDITVNSRLDPRGSGDVEAVVLSDDAQLRAALPFLGFELIDDRFVLTRSTALAL